MSDKRYPPQNGVYYAGAERDSPSAISAQADTLKDNHLRIRVWATRDDACSIALDVNQAADLRDALDRFIKDSAP